MIQNIKKIPDKKKILEDIYCDQFFEDWNRLNNTMIDNKKSFK